MKTKDTKTDKREMRHRRIRAKIRGNAECPRISVFRSNKHLWVQLIDDSLGKTLVSASDKELTAGKKAKKDGSVTKSAGKIGELIAKKALEKKVNQAVFDRGGYKYHGAVRAVAEGARRGGLKF